MHMPLHFPTYRQQESGITISGACSHTTYTTLDKAHERPVKQPLDTVKKLTGCRMMALEE
jgi:hypothetical protein